MTSLNNSSANNDHKSSSINLMQQVCYALPVVPTYFLVGPLYIIQGIYAKYFGLALSSIAIVLLVSRLFDAISDPVIGCYADKYYSRHGSRKPFVVAGGILLIISSWFLYVPPTGVSTAYFLVWFLIFYLSFTLFEIPHLAWGSELTTDPKGKNSLYGWRAIAIFMGSLIFFAVPLLPMFETNAFTPQTLKWSVLAAVFLMGPLLYHCVKAVPSKLGKSTAYYGEKCQKKENLTSLLSSILDNLPLLWYLIAFLCYGIGTGMWFALQFLFVDSYLGLGENFAWIYVASFGSGTLTLIGWPKLASCWGKQAVWALAIGIVVIGIVGSGLLSPGETSEMPLLFFMTVTYSGIAAVNILAPSILADIVDYGTWKFGRGRAGTYFALYTVTLKTSFAIGSALGLGVAGWYGFDATAMVHSEETVFGLRLAMVWLPIPIIMLSILFIALIPINTRHHAIIQRYFESRRKKGIKKLRSNYTVTST